MLSCMGISFSDWICSERRAASPRSEGWILPRFLRMFRWITPPMLALRKPRAATVRPKLLPPEKPYSVSKMLP